MEASSMPSDTLGAISALQSAVAPQGVLGPKGNTVRAPRGWFLVNGTRVEALDLEVVNNGFFLADTFQGRARMAADEAFSLAAWASEDVIEIELIATDGITTTTLLAGLVDDVELDADRRLVIFSGRDFTGDLIETKTTEKWPNKTASEIASEIAGRHNLTPVVTATSTTAGTYYSREHAVLTDDTTEWNLLTYLAEQEGFSVYVAGRELHFEKPADPAQAPRWQLNYEPGLVTEANASSLRMRRNLTVAKEVVVKVVSWNAKQKRAFDVTRRADRSRRSRPRSQAAARTFVFRVPQMSEQQAIEYADRKLREISQTERTIDVTLPADLRVTARHVVALNGTASEFDQEYLIDTINWSVNMDGGLGMRLVCRNIAPASTAAL
jgi:phage protein D